MKSNADWESWLVPLRIAMREGRSSASKFFFVVLAFLLMIRSSHVLQLHRNPSPYEPIPQGEESTGEIEGMDEIRALAMVRQQNLVKDGDTEGAAEIQKALDTIEIVEAQDATLKTLQGFADKFGGNLKFFRAENGHLLGSNGVSVGTNGDVFVRWDASAPQVIASYALHEVIHVVGKGNFDAMNSMYEALKAIGVIE